MDIQNDKTAAFKNRELLPVNVQGTQADSRLHNRELRQGGFYDCGEARRHGRRERVYGREICVRAWLFGLSEASEGSAGGSQKQADERSAHGGGGRRGYARARVFLRYRDDKDNPRKHLPRGVQRERRGDKPRKAHLCPRSAQCGVACKLCGVLSQFCL